MLVKMLGSGLVFFACFIWGMRLQNNLKSRISNLNDLKKIMTLLRGEILYHQAELSEALFAVSFRLAEPYSGFCRQMVKKLDEKQSYAFHPIWIDETQKLSEQIDLKKQDLQDLQSMGENLGYLDKDMQEKQFQLYFARLEEQIQEGKKEYQKKGKLYPSLGVMSGILFVIIFL
ncbi:hypothetical protein FACS189418_0400 [Clostridia bacterium]|nr:hypothetical protein FACS189418_0400 [Clostridia bacterium]